MEPAFYDGDHVLTFNWVKPHKGDVVVFNDEGRNLIKRVKKIKDGKFFVRGDNRKYSSKVGSI